MIGTIRKHSKWLWAVVITATIVTFVFWGSQTPQGARDGRNGASYGSISGQPITPDELNNAYNEVRLRFFFSHGDWPDRTTAKDFGYDMEKEPYYRLMLIQKVKQLNIEASEDAAAYVASQALRSLNTNNPIPLNVFEKQVLNPHGLTTADFARFIRHDLQIQQLISSVNLSGKLVTPQEAKALYIREHEELSTEAVFFSASNHLADVSITPEVLSEFYTNYAANYRLPKRVQVSFVRFDVTNLLTQAKDELEKTNLTDMVEANYQRLGTNFFSDAKSPEEAKARIREQLIRMRALGYAQREASEFASVLFTNEPVRADNMEKVAKEKGLALQISAPFDREEGPADLKVRQDFIKSAFGLTSEEPFAGPLLGEDGAYVVALRQTLPERLQSLEEVRAHATEDCRFLLAMRQAYQEAAQFYQTATNGLAGGKTFAEVCKETNVKPISLPPVALATRDVPEIEKHVSLGQFKQAAFGTGVGRLSNLNRTSDGAFALYVKSRLPVDELKMRTELPKYTETLRRTRQAEAFNDWFRREADRNLRDTPIFQRPAPNVANAPAR